MPSARSRVFNISSIAVIGAGPSGIAAAKSLLAENAFQRIDIIEQRSKISGLWAYDPSYKRPDQAYPIPQTNPDADPNAASRPATYLSPVYDRLETNIPRGLMGFSDLDWPKDAYLFPKHDTVTEYIENYSKSVRHLIKFGTKLISAAPEDDEDDTSGWRVTLEAADRTQHHCHYDAIVAATGHFNKVLLIGNGASGVDIASQIRQFCRPPLLQSSRSPSMFLSSTSSTLLELPEVTALDPTTRTAHFANGHSETNIDALLFCTGYFYSFPWLRVSPHPITDGLRVHHTYQHLFYRPRPTLVFPVLQQRVIPFPMAEVQAAVFARIWSGRLALPSDAEMTTWEQRQIEESGDGKGFHLLKFPKDAEYINMMSDWAMTAVDAEQGRRPPRWGQREFWLRERFAEIRKQYGELGERRWEVKSVGEMGFDFDAWKRQRGGQGEDELATSR
ncbi:Thiol-specific monooxygenase [Sphaceloma murrayae]|uniref:Thiol-specific monooxygenase n=1 Tax=Sphaceloma murrayae TaxID=2082308 RepID=A0A2K1QZU2_9PEZI|nr:Thiol-specific monooxygenase [Sphaceloma murrayae]